MSLCDCGLLTHLLMRSCMSSLVGPQLGQYLSCSSSAAEQHQTYTCTIYVQQLLRILSRHTTIYQSVLSQDAPTKSVQHYISQEIKDSGQGPLLVSSVRGQANRITVHEIAKMGVPEFASLWTVRWLILTCSQRLPVCVCVTCPVQSTSLLVVTMNSTLTQHYICMFRNSRDA